MKTRRRDGAVLRQLGTLYNLGTIGDLTDGQLLERFATESDELAELAFSALVERHEAMVWRVCLAIVRDPHGAEDAFQATFLVLVRKARSLWVRDSLGPWLHQVACRTATCLRNTTIRRNRHERRHAERDSARTSQVVHLIDSDRVAIHEEVGRLPDKYRAPLVLCDLEGRTHQEAAKSLGWPIGTVKSRQAQGRARLRDILARRGLAPSAVGPLVESGRTPLLAGLSKQASRKAVDAAMHLSARAGSGAGVSPQVLSLTRGVLRTMSWIHPQTLAIVTLALGLVSGAAGVRVLGSQAEASKDGTAASAQPVPPDVRTPTSKDAATEPALDAPREILNAQKFATQRAKLVYEIAKLNRELAELDLTGYEENLFKQELQWVVGEIALAEVERKRAEDRLEWSIRMKEKKYVTEAQNIADKVALQQKKFALEQAETKRAVLERFTKGKTIKELRSNIEKARLDELTKQHAWEQEKAKELELERRRRSTD